MPGGSHDNLLFYSAFEKVGGQPRQGRAGRAYRGLKALHVSPVISFGRRFIAELAGLIRFNQNSVRRAQDIVRDCLLSTATGAVPVS